MKLIGDLPTFTLHNILSLPSSKFEFGDYRVLARRLQQLEDTLKGLKHDIHKISKLDQDIKESVLQSVNSLVSGSVNDIVKSSIDAVVKAGQVQQSNFMNLPGMRSTMHHAMHSSAHQVSRRRYSVQSVQSDRSNARPNNPNGSRIDRPEVESQESQESVIITDNEQSGNETE